MSGQKRSERVMLLFILSLMSLSVFAQRLDMMIITKVSYFFFFFFLVVLFFFFPRFLVFSVFACFET